jgi:hypothetical protein
MRLGAFVVENYRETLSPCEEMQQAAAGIVTGRAPRFALRNANPFACFGTKLQSGTVGSWPPRAHASQDLVLPHGAAFSNLARLTHPKSQAMHSQSLEGRI